MDQDSTMILTIIAIVLLIAINAICFVFQKSITYFDANAESGQNISASRRFFISYFLHRPLRYHITLHCVSLVTSITAYSLLITQLDIGELKYWIFTLILIIVFISFGVLIPTRLTYQNFEKHASRLALIFFILHIITYPLFAIYNLIQTLFFIVSGRKSAIEENEYSEQRVKSMLEKVQQKGEINESGKRMINSIFEFDDLRACEIMTPRTDVFMIGLGDDTSEYLDELMEMKHSRIPVYDDDPDNIVGILHIKDFLINKTQKSGSINIKDLLRPAYFVPETKKIDSLIVELQRNKQHMAILIDEFGGFSGVVSIEDIIEQIVGDIDDEFDDEDRIIEQIDHNTFVVDGNVYLDDLFNETGIKLESLTNETVAGFILDLTGEIPKSKSSKLKPLIYNDYEIKILEIKKRRIVKVQIKTGVEEE